MGRLALTENSSHNAAYFWGNIVDVGDALRINHSVLGELDWRLTLILFSVTTATQVFPLTPMLVRLLVLMALMAYSKIRAETYQFGVIFLLGRKL